MIALGDTLISEDVFDTLFACDLKACKGACCVEGESGAPLTEEEVERLEAVSYTHLTLPTTPYV